MNILNKENKVVAFCHPFDEGIYVGICQSYDKDDYYILVVATQGDKKDGKEANNSH